MIDHEQDIRLYGISSRGFELADRYQDDAELDELTPEEQRLLARIGTVRETLMEQFRQTVINEGGLPKAGNPEREWLENLADRWYGSLSGSQPVFDRLLKADREWLEEIEAVRGQGDWPAPIQEALATLGRHVKESRAELQQTAGD